jgi:hypothetical protein
MITWYSMDRHLSLVNHEGIDKEDALMLVEGYFSRYRSKYESAEEAIAETMFGFLRSKSEFIEICINGLDAISFRYQVRESKKVLFLIIPRTFQRELTLGSKEETKTRVGAFFELDSASFKKEIGG